MSQTKTIEKNFQKIEPAILKDKMVYKTGTKDKVDFATLCTSGGVVNAYKALQLAADMYQHKN